MVSSEEKSKNQQQRPRPSKQANSHPQVLISRIPHQHRRKSAVVIDDLFF